MLNTRSGRRYEKDYGERIQASKNSAIPENPTEKEAKTFKYDFIDHISQVPTIFFYWIYLGWIRK